MVATCSTPKYISIHAPTRGATVGDAICLYELIISIHAPTRGATVKIILWVSTSTFQSTLPRGERRSCCNKVTVILDFNPRSHEGSDVMWLLLAQRQNVFQSTLPRGERLCSIDNAYIYIHFNPRSHEGSDGAYYAAQCRFHNFNPRSHEGSDASCTFLN